MQPVTRRSRAKLKPDKAAAPVPYDVAVERQEWEDEMERQERRYRTDRHLPPTLASIMTEARANLEGATYLAARYGLHVRLEHVALHAGIPIDFGDGNLGPRIALVGLMTDSEGMPTRLLAQPLDAVTLEAVPGVKCMRVVPVNPPFDGTDAVRLGDPFMEEATYVCGSLDLALQVYARTRSFVLAMGSWANARALRDVQTGEAIFVFPSHDALHRARAIVDDVAARARGYKVRAAALNDIPHSRR